MLMLTVVLPRLFGAGGEGDAGVPFRPLSSVRPQGVRRHRPLLGGEHGGTQRHEAVLCSSDIGHPTDQNGRSADAGRRRHRDAPLRR